ncbi:hypothetical protein HJG54_12840 [Leptolyngbya sp. NK1-12]|uniref:Uncharacterized protein n=1 Tax=Leptolyngbya sp. NK1-12 TaxID=2547451 RepID=A0AA96WUR0_9CYAN|nr:hypothetical protein [Leptolyngbya sp. NK1-12]WNZ23652.1 hypothetical protein HJG54_12840 [Leptolyngbya sp. NK1-12]
MDSEKQQCYQVALPEASHPIDSVKVTAAQTEPLHSLMSSTESINTASGDAEANLPAVIESGEPEDLLEYIRGGQVWLVNSRQRNGVILCKPFHTEFAGPGAAVGGYLDLDCQRVIPMGRLSLVRPTSHQERQNAYLIRRQWIKLTQQVTDKSAPLQRAQMILNQFETYFDKETIARIPDEAFALMVGVLPYTIRMARRPPGKLTVRVRG